MFERRDSNANGFGQHRGTVKVLLADDDEMVRGGIRALLEKLEDVTVAGEVGNGREVIEFLSREVPDVLLMDISMPRRDRNPRQNRKTISFPARDPFVSPSE